MTSEYGLKRVIWTRLAGWLVLAVGCAAFTVGARELLAGPFRAKSHCQSCNGEAGPPIVEEMGGTWYWLRSPDEEKRFVASLFNRYCIRCHGIDGRGVWDIPGVPDFTNVRWQASRSDAQLPRIILEGRGAVMPPFRGTLSLEEAWAMGRYLRTFVPGTEVSKPVLTAPEKASNGK